MQVPARPRGGSGRSGRALRQAGAVREAAEAQIALRGLEGLDAELEAPSRAYEGGREPAALLAHLGLERFRPGQREAVEAALAGRDALVVMPTGGGKSLCYQLPGLAGAELTIVVSPLIALMADQWRRLAAAGHPAVMIASGMPDGLAGESLAAIADGSARILYCSPERFASPAFWNALSGRSVDLLAVDEAHCISEWGHDFRPDYLRLPRVIERLGRPTVMACTATATEEVSAEIAARLRLREPLLVRSGFDRPNLSFEIVRFEGKGSKARKLALLRHGLADPANRPAIVYCGTRRDSEDVAGALRESGLAAAAYHAGLEPDERAQAQHRFMSGDAEVIAATNAFGMGVDKADVRSVWHWAVPTSVEAYYQEAGRAGRDGEPARAVLLAGRSDLGRLVRFIKMREVDPDGVASFAQRLAAGADAEGVLELENPRADEDRVKLAIAERAGAFDAEPAPGGRLRLQMRGRLDRARAGALCREARDRSWRAYRAVESFAFSEGCRRRALLDHFGDSSPGAPLGRCCDVCAADSWLPDPASLAVERRRASRTAANEAPAELSGADERLFERLREWRLQAAAGKPAYTVANNRTLAAIAATRPADADALAAVRGVGPAFIERHSAAVLALVVAAAPAGPGGERDAA